MNAAVKPTDMFHVGIVVPDLDTAMEQLSATLGMRWSQRMETEMPTRTSGGRERTVPMKVVYSMDDPHLELIEEVADTIWVCNPYSNLHHLGFYGGALTPTSDGLTATGCPLEISDWNPETGAPGAFAFHRTRLGVRIEVVDAAFREILPLLWVDHP